MNTDQIISLAPYVLSFLLGAATLWQNRKKATTQKVLETVILGVEQAAKLPPSLITGGSVKKAIQMQALAASVEPLLKAQVQRLTEPDGASDEDPPPAVADDSGADRP